MGYGEFLPASGRTVGYWKLSDTSDSSGNSRTLTNVNTVTFPAGKFSNCGSFNGTNQYLYNASTTLNLTGPATYICWFNASSTTGTRTLMVDRMVNNSVGENLIAISSGSIIAHSWSSATSWKTITGPSISTGVWYMVAYVLVTSNDRRLFLNGVKVGTETTSMTLATTNLDGFCIGAEDQEASGVNNYFSGYIDEVIIENVAWSDEKIRRYYAAAKGRFVASESTT